MSINDLGCSSYEKVLSLSSCYLRNHLAYSVIGAWKRGANHTASEWHDARRELFAQIEIHELTGNWRKLSAHRESILAVGSLGKSYMHKFSNQSKVIGDWHEYRVHQELRLDFRCGSRGDDGKRGGFLF